MNAEPRLLVTGATGFLGGYVCRELLRRGTSFGVFVRSRRRADWLEREGVRVHEGDVTDPAACAAAADGYRSLIHLAAAADVSDAGVNRRVNVDGLANVLAACRAGGVARLLFVSSTCAGRPQRDAYGDTKLAGEELVRACGLDATILRPTMIYGRGSKEFETFVGVVRRSPVVPLIGDGRNLIQPVAVSDAVSVVLDAIGHDATRGCTYDLAGATPVSFDDFVQLVARALGRPRRTIVHVPAGPLLLAARLLGRVLTHVPLTVDQVMAFLQNTQVDLEPLRRDLGFTPLTLEAGLPTVLGAGVEARP